MATGRCADEGPAADRRGRRGVGGMAADSGSSCCSVLDRASRTPPTRSSRFVERAGCWGSCRTCPRTCPTRNSRRWPPTACTTSAGDCRFITTRSATGAGGDHQPLRLRRQTTAPAGPRLSFAASRSKTLLIDFDVVGGGLTARTNTIIRRRIGQVLLQQGLVAGATGTGTQSGGRVGATNCGDVLVKLGYVLPEELEAGLAARRRTLGLLDAMAGEPLEDCIAPTGVPNLSVLPLGEAGPRDIAVLAPSTINGIISERGAVRHDPDRHRAVLGSLEASLVASQVDQVALVVCAGSGGRWWTAHRRAHRRGRNVAGIVFNRAGMNDLLMMSSGSGSGEYRGSRPPLLEAAAGGVGRAVRAPCVGGHFLNAQDHRQGPRAARPPPPPPPPRSPAVH